MRSVLHLCIIVLGVHLQQYVECKLQNGAHVPFPFVKFRILPDSDDSNNSTLDSTNATIVDPISMVDRIDGFEDDNEMGNFSEKISDDADDAERPRRHLVCVVFNYRTADGHCNNLFYPKWGQSFKPYARLLLPQYGDGRGTPRNFGQDGFILPTPRIISLTLAKDFYKEYSDISYMLMQFGQFVNHDVTNKPVTTDSDGNEISCCGPPNSECYPVNLPMDDPVYSKFGSRCMNFVRAKPYLGRDYHTAYREQYNTHTAFVDGSQIYGSSADESRELRLFRGGLLQYTAMRGGKPLLPIGDSFCRSDQCFKAGDFRVNMFPSLAALHTVFMREHNAIAVRLQDINPFWNDEQLYQEARKIVGAILQHITYNEFLPLVLGPGRDNYGVNLVQSGYYKGYNANVNPTLFNVFTAAAFRFGHSLVQAKFKRYLSNHMEVPSSPWLGDEFFNSSSLWRMGEMDSVLTGLIDQKCQMTDSFFSYEMTNRLYEAGFQGSGQDIFAINIQRGRENGIPPYNDWRQYCGLPRVGSFDELGKYMTDSAAQALRKVYRNVNDIDLYPAGISEIPVGGGLVGPVFSCLIGKQFYHLRAGDRFWYENSPQYGQTIFTPDQLAEIRKITLARVLCDNSEIETIQKLVMKSASDWNPRFSCGDEVNVPRINLFRWKDIDLREEMDNVISGRHAGPVRFPKN